MFEYLNNELVQLMLDLSREKCVNIEGLRFRISKIDLNELFALSRQHEMHGVVASHIIANDICNLPDSWKKEYESEKKHLQFLKSTAIDICKEMNDNGINMVVLKNGGIMCDMINDEAACPMEDIDSLVRKSDFLKAHDLLIQRGLTFKFRSEYEKEELQSAFRDGSTEYFIETPDGKKMWFELAWRAIAGRWIRQDLEPDTDLLMERSYFAEGTKVGILSPEDNLLQVCVHTAKHSYVRAPGLRLHLDVERIVAHNVIDWDVFVQKVCDAHVKTSTYFSLFLAKLLFHTEIPESVLTTLRPTKAKRNRVLKLIDKVGLLYPKEKKFSKLQFLRFQSSLYDDLLDMWFVICPKNKRLYEMYGYRCPLLTPHFMFIHTLDLLGVRKKQ